MSGLAKRITHYEKITRTDIDKQGNLRLYRRRGLWVIQVIFHPHGEWLAYDVERMEREHAGRVIVYLAH